MSSGSVAFLLAHVTFFVPGLQVEDLFVPGSIVKKLAGDMGFIEGPVWIPEANKLLFTDVPRSKIMGWSAAEGLTVFREDSKQANGQTLDLDGRLVTFRHEARDVVREEADGSLSVLVNRFNGKRLNSPNDGVFSSNGSLWFTDPPWGRISGFPLPDGCPERCQDLPGNYVFRFDPETNEIVAVIKDLCMPNGIAFSPDERYLYVADTGMWTNGSHYGHPNPYLPECQLPPGIIAFEVAGRGLRRKWRTQTICDGVRVDAKGNIYVTGGSDGQSIAILSIHGAMIGSLAIPESPANCAFGGEDYKTLFITAQTGLYSVRLVNSGVTRTSKKSSDEL